jgi:hypothetical protein
VSLWEDPNYEVHQVLCPTITVEQIDQALYDKLLAEATASGGTFSGSTAIIHGCTFDWNYDAASQTLTATCTRKPFYFGCDEIASKIQQIVAQAKRGI